MIRTFEELKTRQQQCGQRRRIAAVCAYDDATREALRMTEDFADVIFVNNDTPELAASEAVALIRQGKADVLMKGHIGTDQLLRAVLNKETGLLPPGQILSHMALAEIPAYRKLLFFTDAAVIPYPTHEQRIEQVRYAADICHKLGIEEPRLALLHCAEHGGKQFPFVDGYADIKQKALAGDFGNCIVDGPMDLKCACSLEAMQAKGIVSDIRGEADVLVFPDIEAGNSFYKTLTCFANAKTAGILCGTQRPVIVPSRGDNAEAKYNSILFALACL